MRFPTPQSDRMISRVGERFTLFARIGAVTLPVILLAAAVALRVDAHIGLPWWLRGGLFLGLGLAFGLSLWGWFTLRPRRAAVALMATVLAGFSILLVPNIRPRAVRFIVPWYHPPPTPVRTQLIAASGDPVICRGEAVTLTAYVEGESFLSTKSPSAQILWRVRGEPEQHEPLTLSSEGILRFRLPQVTQTTTYQFRIGELASAWHTVEPVDPVTLTDASQVTIRTGSRPPKSFPLSDPCALRCEPDGELTFSLAFSRRPVQLLLDWRVANESHREPASRVMPLSVRWNADGRLAESVFFPRQSGTVTVRILTDYGFTPTRTVSIQVAPPPSPRWVAVEGWNRFVRTCPPGEAIPVTFLVEDDRGIGAVWVEIVPEVSTVPTTATESEHEPQRLPVPLDQPGSTRVTGRVQILPPNGLRPGDRLRVRLAARGRDDERVSYSPSEGWGTLLIQSRTQPVWEQAILGEHEQIQRVLFVARHDLDAVSASLLPPQRNPDGTIPWTLDYSIRLGNARREIRRISDHLRELSEDIRCSPDLHALVDALS
ncbi:MAG: hypothetical protein LC104_08010, partial [Bacteroidales bacterium]|nr:hypothetical protein [Bacteroidales bacterium]